MTIPKKCSPRILTLALIAALCVNFSLTEIKAADSGSDSDGAAPKKQKTSPQKAKPKAGDAAEGASTEDKADAPPPATSSSSGSTHKGAKRPGGVPSAGPQLNTTDLAVGPKPKKASDHFHKFFWTKHVINIKEKKPLSDFYAVAREAAAKRNPPGAKKFTTSTLLILTDEGARNIVNEKIINQVSFDANHPLRININPAQGIDALTVGYTDGKPILYKPHKPGIPILVTRASDEIVKSDPKGKFTNSAGHYLIYHLELSPGDLSDPNKWEVVNQ
jgi:hypothetical protein